MGKITVLKALVFVVCNPEEGDRAEPHSEVKVREGSDLPSTVACPASGSCCIGASSFG